MSAKRFKVVAASGKPKGKFLANWLQSKSYHLEQEIKRNKPKYFDQYKKGTVIMIDFGVNIGNELSNHHFGIVLNKSDNKLNGVLTVIPLSSKFNKHYLKLDDELFKTITLDLERNASEVTKEIIELESLIQNTNDILNGDGEVKTLTIIKEDNTEEVTTEVKEMIAYVSKKLDELRTKHNQCKDVVKRYKKYNTDSYVCMKNIQTISKSRIITINKLDPSGKIRLSKSTMDKIDMELIKVYTDVKF